MVRPSTATFLSSTPLLSLSLALLQATGSTARASHIGRGCSGEHVAKLNPLMFVTDAASSGEMSKRQDSSSMSSTPGYNPLEMDPTVQCTGYSYAPVLDNKAKFPTIWQTAQLVPGDQVAADLYAKALADVQSLTPNVQVKGTLGGDFSSFTPTYNTSDPDCWWTYRQCDTPKDSKIPKDIINIPEPLSYGIGFDDGPNCSHNAFYQHLSDANVKATMYYIGSNVMNWPYQAQRGLKDGHELAVHTWSHQYLTAMTNEQVFAELYYTQQAIKLVTGVSPLMFRPPFGDIDNRVRVIAASLNMTSVLWETDSDDWRIGTGTPPVTSEKIDANYQSVVDAAKNGSYNTRGTIMLTHELNNFTMSEAIKFLPALQGAFKALVPVAQGLNVTHPYLENNVTFPDFAGQTGSSSNTESASNTASASSTDSASSSAATGSTTAKATGNDVSAANANSASVSGTETASTVAETSKTSNGAMRGMKSLDLVGSMVVAVGIALGSLA